MLSCISASRKATSEAIEAETHQCHGAACAQFLSALARQLLPLRPRLPAVLQVGHYSLPAALRRPAAPLPALPQELTPAALLRQLHTWQQAVSWRLRS